MEEEVLINVNQPEQKSEIGGVNKYYVYTLKGKDHKGDIDITRRYSDFNVLREVLVKRWPGCCIPSLPEKKTIGSGEHIFIQSRRRGLQIFLQTLALNPPIWDSEEINIFLRNSSSDMEKQLSSFLKESPEKLFSKYKSIFAQFDKNEISPTAPTKISQFSSYIKDSKVFLDKLADSTDNMHPIFKSNLQKKLVVLEFVLPDYEKSCLLENDEKKKVDGLLFANEDMEIKGLIEKYKNVNSYPAVLLISQQIKRERRQLQSFQEVIKVLHEFESLQFKSTNKVKEIQLKSSKINAGKQSFFSKIKKQTKEEQIAENQHQMEKAKEEEKMYITLTQIITNLVALKEIDRFKVIRQKAYFKMLKAFGEAEKEMVRAERQIWLRVSQHEKVGEGSQSLGFKYEGKEEEIKHVE